MTEQVVLASFTLFLRFPSLTSDTMEINGSSLLLLPLIVLSDPCLFLLLFLLFSYFLHYPPPPAPSLSVCVCVLSRVWSAWWQAVRLVWAGPLWSGCCRTEPLLWSWTSPPLMEPLWQPLWATDVPSLPQMWVQKKLAGHNWFGLSAQINRYNFSADHL